MNSFPCILKESIWWSCKDEILEWISFFLKELAVILENDFLKASFCIRFSCDVNVFQYAKTIVRYIFYFIDNVLYHCNSFTLLFPSKPCWCNLSERASEWGRLLQGSSRCHGSYWNSIFSYLFDGNRGNCCLLMQTLNWSVAAVKSLE